MLEAERSPRRDLVLLNAAAAIYVGGQAEDFASGLDAAREAIDSGAAAGVLSRLVSFSADQ